MKRKSANELDKVLNYFSDNASASFDPVYFTVRYNKKTQSELTPALASKIIAKLFKDGYLDEVVTIYPKANGKTETNESYIINYDGIYYVENGGYTKKRKREIIKDYLQKSNAIIVLMATVFATWYALFEIWKYYYGYVPHK